MDSALAEEETAGLATLNFRFRPVAAVRAMRTKRINRPGVPKKKGRVSPAVSRAVKQAYAACTGISRRVSMMRLCASTYTSSGA